MVHGQCLTRVVTLNPYNPMKLPNNCKIEAVASKDTYRIQTSAAYLQGDKLIATNGRAIVVLPVEREEHDTDGYIPAKALAAARKLAKRDMAHLAANGCITLKDGSTMPRDNLGGAVFPNWQQCVPKEPEQSHPVRIGFNVKLLAEIAAAMGTETVCIRIQDEKSPIMVYPTGATRMNEASPNAVGVLMPVRLV